MKALAEKFHSTLYNVDILSLPSSVDVVLVHEPESAGQLLAQFQSAVSGNAHHPDLSCSSQ